MAKIKTSKIAKAANAVVVGTGKTLSTLEKASRFFDPLKEIPVLGDSVADIQDLIAMLNDYCHGRYKKVPFVVLLGSAAIAAYLVSPFDLIPDNVPVLGFIDDAFIINIVMEICVAEELDRYRLWRESTSEE